ncbi:hypothetical protein [Paramagnetospirillum magneticum]|uniref:Selenocysteine lyase n=1 Tax=Paramagnetospirillum magneticum (strain ATCC 700264 / AMB-1) TaxID=342108 RepID=Q2W3B7_PARM1|nr:hypothetical protein [Paramagnetospirillum magneticum]BAE51658.1 hypothetical protein amb2854 [Paramagnetospirillum magneticum AMB-1]
MAWDPTQPTDLLLTTGGDERLLVDPESGLNRYGCSPRPRPWAITFASTTATSVSDGAFTHVEGLRRRLAEAAQAGRLDEEYAAAMEEVRGEIPRQCGTVPGTEAILTPSGTDAEFYALHLALAADRRPLTSIVIAPRETASNVLQAASGRHYNATTAMGHHVDVNQPVDAATAARVELAILQVRDDSGTPLPMDKLNRAAEELVEREVARGRRVLLHLLDTSKTGLVAPGVDFTFALAKRFAGHLDVVVDASQLRLSKDSVARYLGHGFMVIITGSKFFTGPPFAGALLVPPCVGGRVQLGQAALPEGYNAYTERHCWPDSWETWCRPMGGDANMGLLMRWWAALWEMAAFHAVPPAEARRILERFLGAIRAAIEASPRLRLLPCPPPERGVPGSWDGLATILTFAATPPKARAPLGMEDLRRLHVWLNRDVSALLPPKARERDRRLAALACHIGQPVMVGETLSGLRLAAGARLVSGARQAMTIGRSVEAFLDMEIAEAKLVLAKLDMLLRHWRHLVSAA